MEAAAGRGGSFPVPSSSPQPLRKQWRAVSDHSSFRNNGSEDSEHVQLSQTDERTIYEEGAAPVDVNFCSITMDGGRGLNDEIMQQRLEEIARQREQLQHMEIELRAQAIARSEILEMQSSFQSQFEEHADAVSKLKEHLEEREQQIRQLEMKLENKDRELHIVKLDNEAAWAKDDMLREQNKELTIFRRERDNSEAERAQHLKQIHDLQEHIQEKESQFLSLEEQHRVAQETILYRDRQLSEAQAWITRVQEMDGLQSTTIQAELRERTEQFNQCWFGIQRQFAEVERHHLQAIQQLQLELAEMRGQTGIYKEDTESAQQKPVDSSSYLQNHGNQVLVNANNVAAPNDNLGFMSNGNLDGHPSNVASSIAPAKIEHSSGAAVVPSPIVGMGGFLPPNQMTAFHPFVVMHPQGVPQSVPLSSSHIPQSLVGHFQSLSTVPPHLHWQHQQAIPDGQQNPNQGNHQQSHVEQTLLSSNARYSYEHSSERNVILPDKSNSHTDQQQLSGSGVHELSNEEALETNDKQHQTSQEPNESSNINPSFHGILGYGQTEQKNEIKDQITISAINQPQEAVSASGQQWSDSISNPAAASSHSTNSDGVAEDDGNAVIIPESATTARTTTPAAENAMEPTLLDERSLLACIVRAIPAGADGRIRISTTLPNRLAKMLAPLHWHDYKKQYGKLDDFVAQHPELFVIEGDFINLREGAQEIISATTAFAKVAAAAASSFPYLSLFPSVALTPVAQNNRQKMASPLDSRPPSTLSFLEGAAVSNPGDSCNMRSQIPKTHNQPNGVHLNIARGNISVKSNIKEVNGLPSENRPSHSSEQNAAVNGTNKRLNNGRLNSGAKQQTRSAGAGIISRR